MVKAYPKYQNTRLPWLEKMPDGWQIKRGKAVFRCIDVRSKDGAEELLTVSSKDGVVPRSSKKITMFMAESYVGYKLCWPGDLVINSLWAWMFGLGFSRHHGIVSSAYGVYRPLTEYVNYWKYFDYLFRSKAYDWELRVRSQGIWTSRLQLTDERFLDMPVLIPPKEEAGLIVNFLSVIDSQIRRYIRAKQQVIKLLNEQKQAIINKAMTRGLDFNARLKPSGIDWIGEIPAHWRVKRLKFIVDNVNEQTSSKKDHEVYIALDQIESWTGKINFPDEEVLFESQVKRFHEGDILFCKLRPYLAKVTRPAKDGVCVGELLVLRLKRDDLLPEFLEQKLRSSQVINIVNSSTFGAKMPRADWSFIGNLMMAYPESTQEQKDLIDYIESSTRQLTFAINQIHDEIKFLTEYRTRIVFDVVTGKIDVRDVKLPDLGEEALQKPIDEEEISEDVEDSEEVVNADE